MKLYYFSGFEFRGVDKKRSFEFDPDSRAIPESLGRRGESKLYVPSDKKSKVIDPDSKALPSR